nr:protein trichome birefringence-like 19 [Tanacetum cinerariifolium]
MTTPTVTSSTDSQMHNNIMAAGSRDRPLMLATGRYPQWRSRFLRYIDTRPIGEALRKCILSGPYKPTTVAYPIDVTNSCDQNFKRYKYPEYSFNISMFWSPYLVKTERSDQQDITQPFRLYLDEFDESWTSQIEKFNYLQEYKIEEREGRKKGIKFAFMDMTQIKQMRPDGHPSKYGQQNVTMANDCVHWGLPGPIDAWNDFLMELINKEDDGHPSKYGHWPQQNVTMDNDCVHWCLPGPIDAWNDFLMELINREDGSK